ncbi:hypothetical protein D9757_014346 [Collybiopsis confluens]|uniref:Uncharacterized protein n=1 Tax=Collybiopsis confluens TaxID=2823264 RepID=A0A8H5FSP4_9AGAR|nr:hypothetical protein D9757_014346 [Collybiopsis confluens]
MRFFVVLSALLFTSVLALPLNLTDTVGRVRPVRDFNVRDALEEVEARGNHGDDADITHGVQHGGPGRPEGRPTRDIGVREADLSKGRPRPARDVIPVLEEARPRPARDLIQERDEIEARDRDVSSSVGHGPPRSRPHNN